MTIKEIGGRVASIWDGLRPVTKKMIVGAMQSGPDTSNTKIPKFFYDAHADWEVSRLLSALDEQKRTAEIKDDPNKLSEVSQLADTCARVLETQSASAEVFIQLADRAIRNSDYKRLDNLADGLAERYTTAEIAEIARQTDRPQIRAIAFETLAMMPAQAIVALLDDSLYSSIAIAALEQKAYEFDSDEARDALDQFDNDDDASSH